MATLRKWGRRAGLLVYTLSVKGRKRALSNLDLAYGDTLTDREKRSIARGSYINLLTTAFEICRASGMPASIEGEINPNNAEACLRAHEAGKGILLLVLHMGNWEACGRWLTRNLPAVNAITRRQKPEWFAELVHQTRQDIGYREIDNKNALRPSLRALRKGEMVIMLIDHYIRRGAVQVDFFRHPAMTSAAAALLAMKTGCAVLVGACYRNGDGSWGCEFSDPVETIMTGNREQDYIANTQRYVNIMEEFVRQHPGDWMWMHNRWKKPRGPIRAMEPMD